jgi:protein-tyrosine phosphatase
MDDGPGSVDESLAMCRVAARDGIRTVVAVPHTLNGVHYNDGEAILKAVEELNSAVEAAGIPLKVLPGSDVRVDPRVPEMIRDGRVMSIGNRGKAVMLEFPDYFLAEPMCRFVEALSEKGILAVVSHPERCAQFGDLSLVRRMVDSGAVIQITAMSLTGEFGQEVRRRTQLLLEEGLVHVISSDAHSPRRRPPILSRAVDAASTWVGAEQACAMVTENPAAVIQGRHP